jgi:hypothetical protein
MLIAQSDDSELLEWLVNARENGGDFVSSLARAALVADWENYPLLRPVLMELRRKYHAYEPTDAVKAELRDNGRHTPTVSAVVDALLDKRTARETILLHIEHRIDEFFEQHRALVTPDVGVAFLRWLLEKDGGL